MRKLIAAINMTIDGYCDHTYGVADAELHDHYTELICNSGLLLYGRTTYQLMQYWQDMIKNPSEDQSENDFAVVMDKTPKLVFSRTLKSLDWASATLATKSVEEEVLALRQQAGKDILIGSPSLIVALTQLGLVDEYQLCVHPVVAGKGLTLFKNINDQIAFKLLKTTTFGSGAIVHYYQPFIK